MYFKHKIASEANQIKWKEDDHPQGIVSLHNAHCYIPPPDDINISRKDFCFVLRANNKDFYFACESKQEQSNWVSFLCKSIEELASGKEMKVAHTFKKVSFARATICSKCESFIWGLGKNGFLCTVCHTCVHKKCVFKIGENCTDKDTSPSGRAAKSKSMAFFSNNRDSLQLPSHSFHHSGTGELTPKEKKIAELKAMYKAVEAREEQDVRDIRKKYAEQVEDILEEFRQREAIEIAAIESKYQQQKDPLVQEISRRALVK